MASILRHCMFGHGRRPLKEIIRLENSFNNVKLIGYEFENIVPTLQFRHCSTKKSKDPVASKKTELVYYGVLTPQIRAVKLFSLITSVSGLACQPVLYEKIATTGSAGAIIGVYTVVGFFTFVTPLLLHLITRKYITHLYYDSEKDGYTAEVYNIFVQRRKVDFTPDDVDVPDVPGMFTTFVAKNKPMFLDPRLFDEPRHYARIMGYDKPIDFKFDDVSPERKKDK